MRTLLTTILLLLAAPALAQPVPNAAPLAATVSVPAPDTGTLPSPRGSTPCVVDWNADGSVNVLDVVAFITAWNAAGPGADFNADGGINVLDVVAFITAWNDGCADEGQVIVLRDSIGPDNTSTNFNWYYDTSSLGGNNGISVFSINCNEDVILTQFRIILMGTGFTYDFAVFDYELRIWDSIADAQADVTCVGQTCDSYYFDHPSSGPTPFGTTFYAPLGARATFEFIFDLDGLEISIEAGSSKTIGLTVWSPGGPAASAVVLESTEPGIRTDMRNQDTSWVFTSDIPQSQHDGRIAVELLATPQP